MKNFSIQNGDKTPPVHKVSVEEVGVVRRWDAVELEHVHEVVELAVDVAADGELVAVRDVDVDERGLRGEELLHVQQHLEGVAAVEALLVLVVLHQGLHELGGYGRLVF